MTDTTAMSESEPYEEYNLDDFDGARAEGFYQMPIIEAQNAEPDELISFIMFYPPRSVDVECIFTLMTTSLNVSGIARNSTWTS